MRILKTKKKTTKPNLERLINGGINSIDKLNYYVCIYILYIYRDIKISRRPPVHSKYSLLFPFRVSFNYSSFQFQRVELCTFRSFPREAILVGEREDQVTLSTDFSIQPRVRAKDLIVKFPIFHVENFNQLSEI